LLRLRVEAVKLEDEKGEDKREEGATFGNGVLEGTPNKDSAGILDGEGMTMTTEGTQGVNCRAVNENTLKSSSKILKSGALRSPEWKHFS